MGTGNFNNANFVFKNVGGLGSTSNYARINVSGANGIIVDGTGQVTIPQSTASSSTSTGSLVVGGGSGGIGCGNIYTTDMVINDTTNPSTGILNINSNQTLAVNSINAYAPNLVASGQKNSIYLGVNNSANNQGELTYKYNGVGATTNLIRMNITGQPGFTVDGNGQSLIQATTASSSTSTGSLVNQGKIIFFLRKNQFCLTKFFL